MSGYFQVDYFCENGAHILGMVPYGTSSWQFFIFQIQLVRYRSY